MAKFVYEHGGYKYEVEADDEKSADEKFYKSKEMAANEEEAKTRGQQELERNRWKTNLDNAKTPWEKFDAGTNAVIGTARQQLPIPQWMKSLHNAQKDVISPSLIKGITPISSLVPQTPELTEFEKDHPNISTGLQIAGGTGAMVAPAGGVSKLMGGGFIKQFMGQDALNSTSHVIDTLMRKGKETSKEDLTHALGWGAVESVVPAALTKGLGQTARTSSKDYWEYLRKFMSPGGSKFGGGAPTAHPNSAMFSPQPISQASTGILPALNEQQIRAANAVVLGGLGAHSYGPLGAIAGFAGAGAASPFIEPAERAMVRGLQHPSTQDIIRALMQQSEHQISQGAPQ